MCDLLDKKMMIVDARLPASRGGRAWRCGNEDCSGSREGPVGPESVEFQKKRRSEMVSLSFSRKVDVHYFEEKNLWHPLAIFGT